MDMGRAGVTGLIENRVVWHVPAVPVTGVTGAGLATVIDRTGQRQRFPAERGGAEVGGGLLPPVRLMRPAAPFAHGELITGSWQSQRWGCQRRVFFGQDHLPADRFLLPAALPGGGLARAVPLA